jgi:hypothetical protein
VKADLQRDLKALRRLAYRRIEKVGALLEALHATRTKYPGHPAQPVIEVIRRWLLMPFTLWPVDFIGIGKHVVSVIEEGGELQTDVQFLISQVSEFPTTNAQRIVAAHEHRVEKGRYEAVVTPAARLKYREKAKLLSQNPTFRQEWRQLQTLFEIGKPQSKNGKNIIRRRMVQERNFRSDWAFLPDDKKCRFRAVFDAFCHRWHLYGMEGNKPLLLKLSVNLTAHGTMIVVPAFWSFDCNRDLDWNEIMKLHRPRVVIRQGPVLSVSRVERKRLAKKTKRLWDELKRMGFRGDDLYRRVKDGLGMGQNFTDREIRRLRKAATG